MYDPARDRPGWRNGRRRRLKIAREQSLAGSSPAPGTRTITGFPQSARHSWEAGWEGHAIDGVFGPLGGDLLGVLGLGPSEFEREGELADLPLLGRLFQRGGAL